MRVEAAVILALSLLRNISLHLNLKMILIKLNPLRPLSPDIGSQFGYFFWLRHAETSFFSNLINNSLNLYCVDHTWEILCMKGKR